MDISTNGGNRGAGTLWQSLKTQQRVWNALFMREIQTRWGRRNLGFAWLFAEPLVFAFPVLFIWSHIRSPIDRGVPMMVFAWTGYMGILIFRHVTGHSLWVVRNNSAVLYHRAVTPLDLFVSVCGLEAMGNIASVVFSFIVMYLLGALPWPADLRLAAAGFLYTTWWSVSIALLVAGLSERFEIVGHIWAVVSYIYLIVSGFMFMASWLPPSVRPIAMAIDPPLHFYEMIRGGFVGGTVPTYYDIPYVTMILAVLTLIGLWQFRHVRDHIQV